METALTLVIVAIAWSRWRTCLYDCRPKDTPANTQRYIPYPHSMSDSLLFDSVLCCTIWNEFFGEKSTRLIQCVTKNNRARPCRIVAVAPTSKRSKFSIDCR